MAWLTGSAALLHSPAAVAAPETGEADARLASILRQYGSRLSPEQVKRLRKILADNERMMAAVRSFPLENGDPPASVLKLHPDSEN